jgi:hypothetical protein
VLTTALQKCVGVAGSKLALSRNGMKMPKILAVLLNLDELSMTKAQTLPTPYVGKTACVTH